jgi:transposase
MAVVDAILNMASTDCQWHQIPREFPPYSTVRGYFCPWAQDGPLMRINHTLVVVSWERKGREALAELAAGRSKLSSGRISPKASKSSPAAGSLNVPSFGSGYAAASPRI